MHLPVQFWEFAAGALGAIVKDTVQDGALTLPKVKDGKLYLGCIGGALVGGLVGWYYDTSFISAALAGYAGSSLLTNLALPALKKDFFPSSDIKTIIEYIAREEGVDPALALRVAKCESNFDPKAVHTNTDGKRDRGLFQINEKYHPEVTDEQAFSPEFSTRFFCQAFKNGHLDWWNPSRPCWDKDSVIV